MASVSNSLQGEPNVIGESDWLRTTPPFYTERIVFGQLISPKNVTNFFDLLQNFNLDPQIIGSYLTTNVVLVLVCMALKTAYGRLNVELNERAGASGVFSKLNQLLTFLMTAGSLPAFSVLFLFLDLFLWFTLLFQSGNIKTNKVVLGASLLSR